MSRPRRLKGFSYIGCQRYFLTTCTYQRQEIFRDNETASRTIAQFRSGAVYAMSSGVRLWQKGYYERVIREGQDARAIARYIIANPVRAGLVQSPDEYPHVGSDVWSILELMEWITTA